MFFLRFISMFTAFSLFVVGSFYSNATPVAQFLPKDTKLNQTIPTPESLLGYDLGFRHPRHDQLVNYFQTLATRSDRVMLTDMGQTPQLRKQFLVTISAASNLANLDQILAKRHTPFGPQTGYEKEPLVIWLGYSVHGDEASGTNAAMVVAYYLAASQNKDIEELLANTIIVLEPSINPDGMDRFVNWVTTHRGSTLNDDPNHLEHNQNWPTGRTNHFWFDLNRDWLFLTQQESRQRLHYFHQYQPHILGDFHEMGRNSSFFFQPGVPKRTHPLTPLANIELTKIIASYHAKALDQEQRLYFSEENFDDFYYGKGSTYPDINASVGILFEQASSRGLQQQSNNGLLTFEYGIKNHVLTSLSTITAAWENKGKLKKYRHNFYKEGQKAANKEKFSGYLISADQDTYRLNTFLQTLKQHQINIYPLSSDFRHDNQLYPREKSYYVPLEQPQYRVIQALFNQQTNFEDNTFYDVSGWTYPLAMNIEFHRVERTWGLKLSESPWQEQAQILTELIPDAYAYVFEWQDSLAPKLLNNLLNKGIIARVATKSFTSIVNGVEHQFSPGSILIAATWQQQKHWQDIISQASKNVHIDIYSLTTGYTPQGVDLGSSSFKPIAPVKVLLMGGHKISQYEAGEIRYYLDETLNIALSVVEQDNIGDINLSDYSHLILVDGDYSQVSITNINRIEEWIKQGGVIFGQKNGAKWLSDKNLLQADFVSSKQIEQLFETESLSYQDKESLAARKIIAGAIFETELDTSHPLAYGFSRKSLPLFRNSTLIMKRPNIPFITLATYTATPLMSGYTDQTLINNIAHNAALVAHNLGKGRVIASTEVLAFRGYWLGSAKLLANSLFFAKAFDANPPQKP